MRYLQISLLVFFVISCKAPLTKHWVKESNIEKHILNPYFSNPDVDYVYKTSITAYGKHFGGIFIVKKTANNNHRIVMTSEMGAKMFDFEWDSKSFTTHYIMEALDKKMLVNLLQRDLQWLITEKLEVVQAYRHNDIPIFETELQNQLGYYYKEKTTEQLTKIAVGSKRKVKQEILFLDINNNQANTIRITHKNIKLTLDFNRIN